MSLRPLGRPARRALPALDRAMTHAEAQHRLDQHPVVIFSMGKTGTTSLTAALETATGRPVIKAHALSRRGIDRRLAKSERLQLVKRPHFLWTCEEIGRRLRAGGNWDLLCGVRDPVALATSDHFYGIRRRREVGRDPEVADDDTVGHARAIAAILVESFLEVDWFTDELKALTDIDVYAEPFLHEQGSRAYTNGRFRSLVLRSEDLPLAGPSVVATFLELREPLSLGHANAGTSGDPQSPYRRFLDNATLPVDLLREVYSTRLARHFYSNAEREQFLSRWTGALV